MDENQKITLLRAMVGRPHDGADWSDDVLLAYLSLAGQRIVNRAYPFEDNVTDVPAKYAALQCEIAAYLLNKRGAEGEVSHNENGIDRTYENGDVPASLLEAITPYCGVM